MKTLKCQRCGHQWTYKGKNPYATTCSSCKTTVYIKKNEVKPEKTMITGFGIVKKEDIREIDVRPEKKT